MTYMTKMMTIIVSWSWVVQRANSQSAWSKPNSPWRNFPE
jgi:hypothetical protein